MTDSGAIAIRPYRSPDERELVALFRSAFGRSTSEEHWRWKLRQQPTPVDNVWLAVAGELPVFQYAGIPTRFLLAQTPVTAMTSVDTMTAPQFRRRGLLTRVATRAYDAWRASGVAFVIGLPNEQWGSRAAALGWQALFPLQWLLRPLRPEAMLARRLHMPWLQQASLISALTNRALQLLLPREAQMQTERCVCADQAFDDAWEHCKSDWMFSTIRDRQWVNWRFLSSPSQLYELTLARRAGLPVGYAAHRLIESEQAVSAHLAELFVARADRAAHDSLLRAVIETLLETRAESLLTLAIPGTLQYRWLRRAGFIPKQAFSVQLVPLSAQLPLTLMRDRNLWNLSGADFDVI